jgi:hypothetical protein
MSTGCTCGGIQHSNCHPCPRGKEKLTGNEPEATLANSECLPETITTEEIRDLCGECTTCFEQSSVLISSEAAGNQATICHEVLCLMEVLASVTPKRNQFGLKFLALDFCKSFPRFQHVRNPRGWCQLRVVKVELSLG